MHESIPNMRFKHMVWLRLSLAEAETEKTPCHYEYVSLSFSQDELVKVGGISVFMAAMFVSGELAGTGVLSLPQAVGQSGGNPL